MRRMNGRAMHWAESERDHAVWGARNIANATPRRVESGRTMATVLGSRRAEGGYVHNVVTLQYSTISASDERRGFVGV